MTTFIENGQIGSFLLVTILLGGGASWLTGRAIAGTWRPMWQVALYAIALGAATRFFHFALFEHTFLSPRFFAVDVVVCLVFGLLGFRLRRRGQMLRQYRWLYEPSGLLGWRTRPNRRGEEALDSG